MQFLDVWFIVFVLLAHVAKRFNASASEWMLRFIFPFREKEIQFLGRWFEFNYLCSRKQ